MAEVKACQQMLKQIQSVKERAHYPEHMSMLPRVNLPDQEKAQVEFHNFNHFKKQIGQCHFNFFLPSFSIYCSIGLFQAVGCFSLLGSL